MIVVKYNIVVVHPSEEVKKAIKDYQHYKDHILFITFLSVDQYLKEIECICKHVNELGSQAIIYLAAAVSDFCIRNEELVRTMNILL